LSFTAGSPAGPLQPGFVSLVTPHGIARTVADDIAFPNGMAVTADNLTLVVADSYRHQLLGFDIGADGGLSGRRVWADLGDAAPDGICLDAEGAAWYADVPHQHCVRVAVEAGDRRAGGHVEAGDRRTGDSVPPGVEAVDNLTELPNLLEELRLI